MNKLNRIIIIAFIIQITIISLCNGVYGNEIIRLKNQAASTQDDTIRIRILHQIAYFYYDNEQLDSCMNYGNKARKIANNLLRTDHVKLNQQYTQKCNVLLALSIRYTGIAQERDNTKGALDSLQLALQIMIKANDKSGIATIHKSLGWIYELQTENKTALEHYLIAKTIYEEIGNQKKLGYLLCLIGISQRYSSNYGDAIESLIHALKIGRAVNDITTIKEALLGLGFTYMKIDKWEKALEYQKQALIFLIQMNDSSGIARVYSDLGVTHMSMDSLNAAVDDHIAALSIRKKINEYFSISSSYFYLGSIYEKQARYPEALESFKQSLHYSREVGYAIYIIDSQMELGYILYKMGENDLAIENFHEVLKFSQENHNPSGALWASEAIADVYIEEGKNLLAIQWLNNAVSKVQANSFSLLNSVYKKLSDVYILQGNYKMGYKNLLLFNQTNDSLHIAENENKIIKLTSRLEFENKQAILSNQHAKELQLNQAEIKRQKVTRNFSLFGMGVILILAIVFFFRFAEKKKLNKKLNYTLSNLKDTQTQLIHAEKMASLGELTAGIAHEIQNPLNFVNNFSELSVDLLDDLYKEIKNGNEEEIEDLSNDIKKNLEKISEHGKRASSIVYGMLGHSRKESGQKEPTNINMLADEYLRLAYHGLRAKDKSFNADFESDLDESIPKINLVPQDIGRVILNLINNAFYACGERNKSVSDERDMQETERYKPKVIVSTKIIQDQIEIKVKDNGNGIPEDVKVKIFQPFFTTKPSGQGTGLGLSLSFDIITKGHGGSLEVNTKEGEFTEFIINLPIT